MYLLFLRAAYSREIVYHKLYIFIPVYNLGSLDLAQLCVIELTLRRKTGWQNLTYVILRVKLTLSLRNNIYGVA